jgi:hypothetical protein
MKRVFVSLLLVALSVMPTVRTQAQIIDAIQQAIIAAIVAADVAVQQAQNSVIDLQNAQKELENQLSLTNLGQIGSWEQNIKDIYSNYFNELWEVKNVISTFQQITSIIAQQKQLVTEYQQAYARVQQDNHFTPSEVTYIYNVYTGIINQSVKSVDEILQVLTSFSFQMSDASRLRIISQASSDIQHQTNDLRNFNSQTAQTSLQRAQSQQDINSVMSLYGLSGQ